MADSTDYKKWVERAKQDLRMLEIIYNEGLGGMEDSFCYICHQAAEKLIKSFIVKQENIAPRTHDLIFLLSKCLRYKQEFSSLSDSLTVLNEYAVAARYPNDFEDVRTIEDAKEAYNCILEVKSVFIECL